MALAPMCTSVKYMNMTKIIYEVLLVCYDFGGVGSWDRCTVSYYCCKLPQPSLLWQCWLGNSKRVQSVLLQLSSITLFWRTRPYLKLPRKEGWLTKTAMSIIVPNFMVIGQSAAKIWWFLTTALAADKHHKQPQLHEPCIPYVTQSQTIYEA